MSLTGIVQLVAQGAMNKAIIALFSGETGDGTGAKDSKHNKALQNDAADVAGPIYKPFHYKRYSEQYCTRPSSRDVFSWPFKHSTWCREDEHSAIMTIQKIGDVIPELNLHLPEVDALFDVVMPAYLDVPTAKLATHSISPNQFIAANATRLLQMLSSLKAINIQATGRMLDAISGPMLWAYIVLYHSQKLHDFVESRFVPLPFFRGPGFPMTAVVGDSIQVEIQLSRTLNAAQELSTPNARSVPNQLQIVNAMASLRVLYQDPIYLVCEYLAKTVVIAERVRILDTCPGKVLNDSNHSNNASVGGTINTNATDANILQNLSPPSAYRLQVPFVYLDTEPRRPLCQERHASLFTQFYQERRVELSNYDFDTRRVQVAMRFGHPCVQLILFVVESVGGSVTRVVDCIDNIMVRVNSACQASYTKEESTFGDRLLNGLPALTNVPIHTVTYSNPRAVWRQQSVPATLAAAGQTFNFSRIDRSELVVDLQKHSVATLDRNRTYTLILGCINCQIARYDGGAWTAFSV